MSGWLRATIELLLVLTAGMIVLRRAAGALTRPPDAAGLLIVGLAAAGVLAVGRPWGRRAAYVPAVAVLLLCGALTTPGISAAALAALWGPPVVALVARLLWPALRRAPLLPSPLAGEGSGVRGPLGGKAPNLATAQESAAAEIDDADPPDDVTQQQTRYRAGDGGESIAGWMRVGFQAGQRTAAAHVAFCPPLEGLPQIHVWQQSGPPARLKTAQLLPHGARVDLKLTAAASEPADVILKFAATCPAAASEHEPKSTSP